MAFVIDAQHPWSRLHQRDEARRKGETKEGLASPHALNSPTSGLSSPVGETRNGVGSTRFSSFQAAGKCTPENKLTNETKMDTFRVPVVKHHTHEVAQYLASMQPFECA